MRAASSPTEETLCGRVGRVKFHASDTGYTVFQLDLDKGDPVTVRGTCEGLRDGAMVECRGGWRKHDKYGLQFVADLVSELLPDDEEGIRAYLASGVLPGVGKAVADRIVDVYGEGVFEILDQHPEKLVAIKGVGKKTVERIKSKWSDIRGAYRLT